MVPLSWGLTGMAPGAPGFTGIAPGAPGRATPGGAFIMSMVPLNFGAAAPFRLKPHFEQAVAAS
jgi:hypothetical protein